MDQLDQRVLHKGSPAQARKCSLRTVSGGWGWMGVGRMDKTDNLPSLGFVQECKGIFRLIKGNGLVNLSVCSWGQGGRDFTVEQITAHK